MYPSCDTGQEFVIFFSRYQEKNLEKIWKTRERSSFKNIQTLSHFEILGEALLSNSNMNEVNFIN